MHITFKIKTIFKWAKDLNSYFSKEDILLFGQQAHKEMLDIIIHLGSANKNHSLPLGQL